MSKQLKLPAPSNLKSYSIDTSSLIESWHRRYPRDVFSGYWEWLSELITEGRLVASEMIRIELEDKDEEPRYWCAEQQGLFILIDEEIQQHIQEFLHDWPEIVQEGKDRDKNLADAFVVALAKRDGLIVVSEENPKKKYSIPQICERHGIECIDMLGLMRLESVKFHR